MESKLVFREKNSLKRAKLMEAILPNLETKLTQTTYPIVVGETFLQV